jgi:hypothetical protein
MLTVVEKTNISADVGRNWGIPRVGQYQNFENAILKENFSLLCMSLTFERCEAALVCV